MKVQRFLGIAALILFPLAGFSQSTQLADSLHSRGIEFYESGNYVQSEFYLKEAYTIYKKMLPVTFG